MALGSIKRKFKKKVIDSPLGRKAKKGADKVLDSPWGRLVPIGKLYNSLTGDFDVDKVGESETEALLASIAADKYKRGRNLLDPLEAEARAETQRYQGDTQKDLAQRRASRSARGQAVGRSGRIDPNEVRSIVAGADQAGDLAGAGGAAGVIAGNKQALGSKLRDAAYGQGQAIQGMRGIGRTASIDAANRASAFRNKAFVDRAKHGAYGQIVGTGAGLAADKYGWFDTGQGQGQPQTIEVDF